MGEAAGVPTGAVSGTLARSEIGGDGLVLHSAWKQDAPVGSDGGFSTHVSQEGAQLLTVTDASGALRGLAVSVPAGRGRQAPPLALDARGTALAYLWFNPGILEVDPSEALARLAELEALASFPALASYIQTALPTASLDEILTRREFTDRASACLAEWWSSGRSRAVEPDLETRGGIGVRVADQSNLRDVSMQIRNAGFRYVFIHRRGLHADGTLAEATKVGLVPGAAPLTVGSLGKILRSMGFSVPDLLTSPFLTPATYTDHVNFEMDAGGCEYWIHGVGRGEGEPPPTDLMPETEEEVIDRYGQTVVGYTIMPIIQGLAGVLKISDTAKAARAVWDKIKGSAKVRDDMKKVVDASTTTDLALAMGNFIYDVLGTATKLESVMGALVEAGMVSAGVKAAVVGAWKLLGAFLAGLQVGTTVANLVKMTETWFSLPEWTQIVVKVTGDLDVSVRSPNAVPHRTGGGPR